jgi:hypothetical protein
MAAVCRIFLETEQAKVHRAERNEAARRGGDDPGANRGLEGEPERELQLPGSTERVDARSHSHAVHIVVQTSSAVDLTSGSRHESIQRGTW